MAEAATQVEPLTFDVNAAVTSAIGACDGDLLATIRSLVVANDFLSTQNAVLAAELEEVWQQVSPGFSRGKLNRRRRTGEAE